MPKVDYGNITLHQRMRELAAERIAAALNIIQPYGAEALGDAELSAHREEIMREVALAMRYVNVVSTVTDFTLDDEGMENIFRVRAENKEQLEAFQKDAGFRSFFERATARELLDLFGKRVGKRWEPVSYDDFNNNYNSLRQRFQRQDQEKAEENAPVQENRNPFAGLDKEGVANALQDELTNGAAVALQHKYGKEVADELADLNNALFAFSVSSTPDADFTELLERTKDFMGRKMKDGMTIGGFLKEQKKLSDDFEFLMEQARVLDRREAAPKKQEEPKQEEPKQEEPKQEEPKQEEPKQEPKKEEPKQEEPKREEPKQEEPKQEEPKPEEPKPEEPKQEEPKQEEPKQEEPKQEEPKQEEPKQEEPKQKEPKQEEPKQKEEEIAPSNQLQAAEDMVEKLRNLSETLDRLYGNDLGKEVRDLAGEFNALTGSTKPTEDYIDACRHMDRFLEKKLKNNKSILDFARERQDMGPVLEAMQQAGKFRSPRPEDIETTLSGDPYAKNVSKQLTGNNTAARWIEGYKAELRNNLQKIRQQPDYPEAYVARIMAARELSNSARGKASTLKTAMTAEAINERAAQLMSTDSFRIFAERIKKDDVLPKVEAIFAKKHSHGGELDDLFRDFLKKRPAGKLQNNDRRLDRWMPTVKERIESLQQQAKERREGKRGAEADVSKEAYEINLLRSAAGVRRGGEGLDKKIPYVAKGVQVPDLVEELDEKTSQHLSGFRKKFAETGAKKHILSGHGGKMMESVDGRKNKPQKNGGPQVL